MQDVRQGRPAPSATFANTHDQVRALDKLSKHNRHNVAPVTEFAHKSIAQTMRVDCWSRSNGVKFCSQSHGVDFCSQSDGGDVCSQSDGVDFVVTLMVEIVCSDGFFREWPQ